MLKLPQLPQHTHDPISSWLTKIRSGVARSQPVSGNAHISETPYGIQTNWKNTEGFFMRWRDAHNAVDSYYIGDMVYVATPQQCIGYNTTTGEPIIYESFKGVYVCVNIVPPQIDIINTLLPSYVTAYLLTVNKRNANTVYAPVYPYPTLQTKYWHLIAFDLLDINVCVDGQVQAVKMQGAVSGSTAA